MRETQSFNSSIKKEKALQFAVLFLARLEGLEPPTYWFVAAVFSFSALSWTEINAGIKRFFGYDF